MDEYNPYAPPKAVAGPSTMHDSERCWRRGPSVILAVDGALPPRCVKCNAPAELPIRKRTIYWHQPFWYLLVLLWVIVYVLVAIIVRRTAKIAPGLCTAHRKQRGGRIATAWAMWLASLGALVLAIAYSSGTVAIGAAVLFLAAIIYGSIMSRILWPVRMDATMTELRGAGPEFLDSLPPI